MKKNTTKSKKNWVSGNHFSRTNSYIVGVVLVGLFAFSIYQMYFRGVKQTNAIIQSQAKKLSEVLKKVHADCKIIGFDGEKNHINFLNVAKFEGSEVGPVNLAHPENWKGPYLKDNLTIQGKDYYILKTKADYYIVPGDGVKLSDGKIMGKDIVVDSKTDVEELLKQEKGFYFRGYPIILKLDLREPVESVPPCAVCR